MLEKLLIIFALGINFMFLYLLIKIYFILASMVSSYYSISEPANPFDDFDGVKTVKQLNQTELAGLDTEKMLKLDENNQEAIYFATSILVGILQKSQEIVNASYLVAKYTPDLHNGQYSKFWRNDVSLK